MEKFLPKKLEKSKDTSSEEKIKLQRVIDKLLQETISAQKPFGQEDLSTPRFDLLKSIDPSLVGGLVNELENGNTDIEILEEKIPGITKELEKLIEKNAQL